jgi:hypothetical protein
LDSKNKEAHGKSQYEGLSGPRSKPEGEYRMGVTKHFVQESKQVKLGTKANDLRLAADLKCSISSLSKFGVENGKIMADERDRK